MSQHVNCATKGALDGLRVAARFLEAQRLHRVERLVVDLHQLGGIARLAGSFRDYRRYRLADVARLLLGERPVRPLARLGEGATVDVVKGERGGGMVDRGVSRPAPGRSSSSRTISRPSRLSRALMSSTKNFGPSASAACRLSKRRPS